MSEYKCRNCGIEIKTKAQKEMYMKTLGFCTVECMERFNQNTSEAVRKTLLETAKKTAKNPDKSEQQTITYGIGHLHRIIELREWCSRNQKVNERIKYDVDILTWVLQILKEYEKPSS